MKTELKVISVRYFESVKGMVGYVCQTNINGLNICNNGDGGATFLRGAWRDMKPFHHLKEFQLEELIDNYEGLTKIK